MEPIQIMEKIEGTRILVLGDVILDQYVDGSVSRVSPEAPVPVLNVTSESLYLGGAANVAINASTICADVCLVYVEPESGFGTQEIIGGLDKYSVRRFPIRHPRAPTVKTRFRSAGQQLIRVDSEDATNLGVEAEVLQTATNLLMAEKFDAMVISDYNKGFFTDESLKKLIGIARSAGVATYVDPKRYEPSIFDGVTLLKPNRNEALRFLGNDQHDHSDVSRKIRDYVQAEFVVTTNASGKIEIASSSGVLEVPAPVILPVDVSGAGDTFLAWMSAAHATGVKIDDACRMAASAASAACLQAGVKPPNLGDVLDLYVTTYQDSSAKVLTRSAGKLLSRVLRRPMVFTNGCFDVLHPGHISLLEFARSQGASLVVGLNSDESVGRLKGPLRPLQDSRVRSRVLASLACVSAVVEFSEDDPLALIEHLRPDILVKGGDYQGSKIVGQEFVELNGGRVVISPSFGEYSTTRFVEQIKRLSQFG